MVGVLNYYGCVFFTETKSLPLFVLNSGPHTVHIKVYILIVYMHVYEYLCMCVRIYILVLMVLCSM